MGNLGVWQIVIIAAIIILLFGSRKLPELARGVGSSLRIFRAETKGMMDDDEASSAQATTAQGDEPRAVDAPKPAPSEPVHNPVSESATDQTKRDG
jgi:sec-independent protein translocase protein TatA